jgi:type IV secretion system protein VirD4
MIFILCEAMAKVRTYFAVFIAMVAFSFLSQVRAQSPNPLVEDGVQLLIEQQGIAHLQRTGQLDRKQYQLIDQAFQQHKKDYNQKVARLPADQQASIKDQVANRLAIVLPPIKQKWDDEEFRVKEEAKAQEAKRSKELETNALAAAEFQADRTFLQRQLQQKTISPQEAESKDSADLAKIAAFQTIYSSYGGNWVTRFNQRLQQLTDKMVTERDLKERLADISSEVGKDAHRAAEFSLTMLQNQIRQRLGAITVSRENQQDAPLKTQLAGIKAKYATGGPLAASIRDFNERVENLIHQGQEEKRTEWDRAARAEVTASRPPPAAPTVAMGRTTVPTAISLPANSASTRGFAPGSTLRNGLHGSIIICLIIAVALLLIMFRAYRKQSPGGQRIDGYGKFSMAYVKRRRVWIPICAIAFLLFATVLWSLVASVLSGLEALSGLLLCPASIFGFFWLAYMLNPKVRERAKIRKNYKEGHEKFERLMKESDVERRQWFESLGATHPERVKTINEMFDRKSKTINFATTRQLERFKEGELGWGKEKFLDQFLYVKISRNLAAMEAREREFLRVIEFLNSFNGGKNDEFYEWAKIGLLWSDGKASIEGWLGWLWDEEDKGIRADDRASVLKWYITKVGADVDKIINSILKKLETLASEQAQNPELVALLKSINARLKGGSAWLSSEDVSKTPFAPQNNFALRIGLLDDTGQELTYSGEGSLISIAPPGSGKTQCNVFPNLLTWAGPAVVLDVKGEIYAKTSKWRSENVGPVFKFSPLDPAKSHCYNPLSFIRQEADFIWEDSRFLADMMIVPSGGTDPFWENKARDVLTAALAHVCYSNTADHRPMSRILEIIHGGSAWEEMVIGLQTAVDVRSMMQQGTSLSTMNEKTRDSVLQTAQSSLSAWSGERISRVTQKSDWSPLDLRSGRNPTIYICLKPSEVDSYISLLRVFIAQHIRMLTSELPPHGVAPILFLLDELPRLKQMPPVEEAIEIGRQYGLRLWMFAQSLGQLEQAYPNAEGIVGSCAVRIFMNPSSHDGTAEKLSEELGFRESALDGSRLKIVEAADLAGPEYKDYQIVIASSCKPVKVKKSFAWQDAELTKRMGSL